MDYKSGISVVYHTMVAQLGNPNSSLVWDGKFRIDCPFCDGGSTKEKDTMQLFAVPKGHGPDHSNGVFFKCYRASCGKTGFVSVDTSISDIVLPSVSEAKAARAEGEYREPLANISEELYLDALDLYPALEWDVLRAIGVKTTEKNECSVDTLYVPLFLYKNSLNSGGYHLRSMWPGYNKVTKWDSKTAMSFQRGAWFNPKLKESTEFQGLLKEEFETLTPKNPVIVVEDALSALVVARYLPTYALLGATLSSTAAAASFAQADLVLLWVDPDMWEVRPGTTRAPVVDLVSRLSSYCPVVPRKLTDDPKYLEERDLREFIQEDIKGAVFGQPSIPEGIYADAF